MSSFLIIPKSFQSIAHKDSLKNYKRTEVNNFIVFYKGNHDTLLYSFNELNSFIVSGVGISAESNYKFFSKEDWKQTLHNSNNISPQINGHYACCLFTANGLVCFNDTLGLRDIYYSFIGHDIIITTRYDLIKYFITDISISQSYIAGNWLTSIPPFYKTPYKKVNRLGPCGRLEIDNYGKIKLSTTALSLSKTTSTDVQDTLVNLTLIKHESKKSSLGISGGLDSRTLLSILLAEDKEFNLHTFGSDRLADVRIAKEIAKLTNSKHLIMDQFYSSVESVKKLICDYIPFSGLSIPVSDLIHIHYHKQLNDAGYTILDGGFGEIGRRQFLNRFLLEGKNIILQGDTNSFLKNIRINRGDFFNDDFRKTLEDSLIKNAEEMWKNMEDVSHKNIYQWLDLFAVRYKLPNAYSYGQHCLDQIVLAYMPFAQHKFLKKTILLSSSEKRNGKLYRKIIHDYEPRLEKINLVKDYVEYPYKLGTVSSYFFRKVKRKVGKINTVDPLKYILFDTLREYIGDEIASQKAREYGLYDMAKLNSLHKQYYSGDKSKLAELDWWLTFHEWYKIMYENS